MALTFELIYFVSFLSITLVLWQATELMTVQQGTSASFLPAQPGSLGHFVGGAPPGVLQPCCLSMSFIVHSLEMATEGYVNLNFLRSSSCLDCQRSGAGTVLCLSNISHTGLLGYG